MMKKVANIVLVLVFLLVMATDAFALSLLRPYGFTLPMEEFAKSPSAFANDIYNVLNAHTVSFEDDMLKLTSKGTDSMTTFNFGGKDATGTNTSVAPTGGKQVSRITFSISKSDVYFDNNFATAFETVDCNAFVNVGGTWYTFRLKGYTFRDTDYIVKLNWGGPDSDGETAIAPLNYDELYTVIFEADVEQGKASMRVEDANGNVLGKKYAESGVLAARNGFRFRVRDDFDAKISEVSIFREAYLVKDLTVEEIDDNIEVSVYMANDCTERKSLYGEILSAPILLVGQFDSEDRLLEFNITEPQLEQRVATSTALEYTLVTDSLTKHKNFHHAKACVWSDLEEMLSYCGMAQISNENN